MVCLRNICINTLNKGVNDDDYDDDDDDNNNNNNHVANTQLGNLLTSSGLTRLKDPLTVSIMGHSVLCCS